MRARITGQDFREAMVATVADQAVVDAIDGLLEISGMSWESIAYGARDAARFGVVLAAQGSEFMLCHAYLMGAMAGYRQGVNKATEVRS